MLEKYFVFPETVERVRSCWIGQRVEQYVCWLSENGYKPRTICRRVPILVEFGEFAALHGATKIEELPGHIEAFVASRVQKLRGRRRGKKARREALKEIRNPIQQMLRLVLPGFVVAEAPEPFQDGVPWFLAYLKEERGLRAMTIRLYRHYLRRFEAYLTKIGCGDLSQLSPPVISGFVTDSARRLHNSSLRDLCGILRVFVRYLHREEVLPKDISGTIESPRIYKLSDIPRFINWNDVRRMLEAVDRRSGCGKRDYAILLLLVTYGLRAREISALTLDDIDWRMERLRVPERKAAHSTAFPLSPVVGEAILDYLQNGRPQTSDRRVFFRVRAPQAPLTFSAVSGRTSHYLRKAGIEVPRPGSHTLRHACVQRLIEANFTLKEIGDYVGHRSPQSTEIYTKVDIEGLRSVALGDGEEIL